MVDPGDSVARRTTWSDIASTAACPSSWSTVSSFAIVVSSIVSDDDGHAACRRSSGVERPSPDRPFVGPLNTSTGLLRRDGFSRAMAHHGLPVHIEEASRFNPRGRRRAGARAHCRHCGDYRDRGGHDMLALGIFDAMRMLGLRCPDDISVVGHNDMPLVDLILAAADDHPDWAPRNGTRRGEAAAEGNR